MSGHASKIGNDVSQALFDGRMVPDSTTLVELQLVFTVCWDWRYCHSETLLLKIFPKNELSNHIKYRQSIVCCDSSNFFL